VGKTVLPSTPPATATWAPRASSAIWRRLEAQAFAGYDPYDAMASGGAPARFCSSVISRRLATQLVKRCPVSLQPVLRIPRAVSAYTLGHALIAVARSVRSGVMPMGRGQEVCRNLLIRLQELRAEGYAGLSWGYHFPLSSRFSANPAGMPNIIVTAFVAKGMAEVTGCGLTDCGEELERICDFILQGLPRETTDAGQRFGYLPSYGGSIHNANALAALVLAQAGMLRHRPDLVEEADRAAADVVAHQRPDGSWPYSEDSEGNWVDGFHTGFVLDGVHSVAVATGSDRLRHAAERGMEFYLANLFGADGKPYYMPQRHYPLDALSAAQAIETLGWARRSASRANVTLARVVEWALRNMVTTDGRVAYQVHRLYTDWRQFPRWSMAPMCSALAGVAAQRAS